MFLAAMNEEREMNGCFSRFSGRLKVPIRIGREAIQGEDANSRASVLAAGAAIPS
jgi:hypothetical protein